MSCYGFSPARLYYREDLSTLRFSLSVEVFLHYIQFRCLTSSGARVASLNTTVEMAGTQVERLTARRV